MAGMGRVCGRRSATWLVACCLAIGGGGAWAQEPAEPPPEEEPVPEELPAPDEVPLPDEEPFPEEPDEEPLPEEPLPEEPLPEEPLPEEPDEEPLPEEPDEEPLPEEPLPEEPDEEPDKLAVPPTEQPDKLAAPPTEAPAPTPAAEPTPAPTPGPEPAPSEGEGELDPLEEEDPHDFSGEPEVVEGELANVGTLGFVRWTNRVGGTIATDQLGEIFYITATPLINYSRKLWGRKLSLTFGVPLRFEILDARVDQRFANAGRLRKQDWDEPSDFAQIIRQISYGTKEDRVYLDINQFFSNTIGHGSLVRRYNPNLNFNTRRVAAEFDAFVDYVGGELYVNDITAANLLGGLVFLKPLSLIDRDNYVLRSFSLGVQFFADIDAPIRNVLDDNDVDDDGRRFNEIEVNQRNFQPRYASTEVITYGADAEIKILDERWLDWKTYADYSFIETGIPTDDPLSPALVDIPTRPIRAGGFTWGNLFRMNFGEDPTHAVRIRGEFRTHDPHYLPSYFDTLYEVQRFQYPMPGAFGANKLVNQTKLQQVLGRDPGGPRVFGGYFEAAYRVSTWFAFAFGMELNDQTPDNSLFVHLEVPKLGPFQFLATYQRRNAKDFVDLFSTDFRNTDLVIFQTKVGFHEAFLLNISGMTPFGIGPDALFRNVFQVNIALEIGIKYL